MMNKLTLFCFSIGVGVLSVYAQNQYERSTVTIRVTDQTGVPVTNAFVGVNGYTQRAFEGRSDTNGRFIYTDRIAGGVSCFVYKDGYYETGGQIWVGPVKWTDHPASDYTIVLKKIVSPLPLVFRQFESLKIPLLNDFIPFDIEIGDWTKPFGRGNYSDVWFRGVLRKESKWNFDINVTIIFSNAVDGVQDFISSDPNDFTTVASELKPLQQCPESGYSNSIVSWGSMRPITYGKESWTKNRNYYFRIRTKTNEVNQVIAANVGWINKDIKVRVSDTGIIGVGFEYYYNPDPHSRSLEPKEIADRQRKCPVK